MNCQHNYKKVAKFKEGVGLPCYYELERCPKCGAERFLRVEISQLSIKTSGSGPEPYIKSAYHDIGYTLINYGVKDYGQMVDDPHALEVAMEMFMAAYNGIEGG